MRARHPFTVSKKNAERRAMKKAGSLRPAECVTYWYLYQHP